MNQTAHLNMRQLKREARQCNNVAWLKYSNYIEQQQQKKKNRWYTYNGKTTLGADAIDTKYILVYIKAGQEHRAPPSFSCIFWPIAQLRFSYGRPKPVMVQAGDNSGSIFLGLCCLPELILDSFRQFFEQFLLSPGWKDSTWVILGHAEVTEKSLVVAAAQSLIVCTLTLMQLMLRKKKKFSCVS